MRQLIENLKTRQCRIILISYFLFLILNISIFLNFTALRSNNSIIVSAQTLHNEECLQFIPQSTYYTETTNLGKIWIIGDLTWPMERLKSMGYYYAEYGYEVTIFNRLYSPLLNQDYSHFFENLEQIYNAEIVNLSNSQNSIVIGFGIGASTALSISNFIKLNRVIAINPIANLTDILFNCQYKNTNQFQYWYDKIHLNTIFDDSEIKNFSKYFEVLDKVDRTIYNSSLIIKSAEDDISSNYDMALIKSRIHCESRFYDVSYSDLILNRHFYKDLKTWFTLPNAQSYEKLPDLYFWHQMLYVSSVLASFIVLLYFLWRIKIENSIKSNNQKIKSLNMNNWDMANSKREQIELNQNQNNFDSEKEGSGLSKTKQIEKIKKNYLQNLYLPFLVGTILLFLLYFLLNTQVSQMIYFLLGIISLNFVYHILTKSRSSWKSSFQVEKEPIIDNLAIIFITLIEMYIIQIVFHETSLFKFNFHNIVIMLIVSGLLFLNGYISCFLKKNPLNQREDSVNIVYMSSISVLLIWRYLLIYDSLFILEYPFVLISIGVFFIGLVVILAKTKYFLLIRIIFLSVLCFLLF